MFYLFWLSIANIIMLDDSSAKSNWLYYSFDYLRCLYSYLWSLNFPLLYFLLICSDNLLFRFNRLFLSRNHFIINFSGFVIFIIFIIFSLLISKFLIVQILLFIESRWTYLFGFDKICLFYRPNLIFTYR